MDNKRIKVVDSPTGTGKTSWAIDYINLLPEDVKVIFITPFLSEVDRIKEMCKGKNFVAPNRKNGKGSKRNHLLSLILEKKNIVSTHSLFSNADEELINAFAGANYILILDEAMNVIEKFDFWEDETDFQEYDEDFEDKENLRTKLEIEGLQSKNIIYVDPDTKQIKWIDDDHPWEKYQTFRNLVKRNLMFLVNKNVVVWTFPIDVFAEGVFNEVFILTYQFDWQIQSMYYKYFDFEYSKHHIEKINNKFTLVETVNNEYEREWIENAKGLIKIIDVPSLNRIGNVLKGLKGEAKFSLSKKWFVHNPSLTKMLGNNIGNFFINYTDAKANNRLWTCFVSERSKMINGNVSKKNWLALNARATNNYSNKTALAYGINRFVNPFYAHFFSNKNIIIDQDKYALSEMIQWIWRSAIRNNQPITTYIPSERMRTLLMNYLNNEPIEFKSDKNYCE